ncbi:MAG TPA: DegT/DnrJ/EryC1/StrS family aminotransferase [Candidatus Hydrogenedentes bacterium]|nr:DegT/DnrJ/EryC1/StrS family aminotransferase [Candidatus Hydrogenedentota bacterium]
MDVPFLDLKTPHRALESEILPLWQDILRNAGFIGGPYVTGLEEDLAKAFTVDHAVAVNSGTDALRFIFMALGLRPGDEVITVPNTFIATTEAITQAGGKPVFVDIDPKTYTLDPGKIEAAITAKTRGVVPVHLYGQTADMDPILAIAQQKGLWVVEDAAQSQLAEYKGKKAGSMGVMAATSFYPGKNLGACGEAGAVLTQDPKLAALVRKIRDHGQAQKYYHDLEGYNGRCDALQAAALRVKLRHLPEWNEARRAAAGRYMDLLKNVEGVTLPGIGEGCLPVWHLFVVLVEERDRIAAELKEKGVSTGLHYPIPLHLQKAYQYLNVPEGRFPVTEYCAQRLLSLPMFPELTEAQTAYVCEQLAAAVKKS